MLKNIGLFVTMFVLAPFYCIANEPEVNSLDNLIVNIVRKLGTQIA